MVFGTKTRGIARGFSSSRVPRSAAATRQPAGGSTSRGASTQRTPRKLRNESYADTEQRRGEPEPVIELDLE
jgi:hypothetical protein